MKILLSKIKRFLSNLFFYIPLSMKGFEKEVIGTEDSVNKEISQGNLGSDLLRGEVTQAVEELRHSNYQVYRESNNYKYVGDGCAIKKEKQDNNGVIKFVQPNKEQCQSVLEGLKSLDEFIPSQTTLTCGYNDIPKFKIENYILNVNVEINKDLCKINLVFDKNFDKNKPQTKMFLNELRKMNDINLLRSCDLYSNMNSIFFTTYKASGEDDMIRYSFHNLIFQKYEETENEINVSFLSIEFEREDLMAKYFSETMHQKYQEKAPKNNGKMKIF